MSLHSVFSFLLERLLERLHLVFDMLSTRHQLVYGLVKRRALFFDLLALLCVHFVKFVDKCLVVFFRDEHGILRFDLPLELCVLVLQHFQPLLQCAFLDLRDLLDQMVV